MNQALACKAVVFGTAGGARGADWRVGVSGGLEDGCGGGCAYGLDANGVKTSDGWEALALELQVGRA